MNKGGAPNGNSNAAKGKAWRDELDKALKQYENKEDGIERGQALRKVAIKVVEQALAGSKDAWQEIGNRLDGKAAQSIEHSGQVDHVTYDAALLEILNGSSPETEDAGHTEPTTH